MVPRRLGLHDRRPNTGNDAAPRTANAAGTVLEEDLYAT
jgi:hypothetical protein